VAKLYVVTADCAISYCSSSIGFDPQQLLPPPPSTLSDLLAASGSARKRKSQKRSSVARSHRLKVLRTIIPSMIVMSGTAVAKLDDVDVRVLSPEDHLAEFSANTHAAS